MCLERRPDESMPDLERPGVPPGDVRPGRVRGESVVESHGRQET